jgi:hypothetical protein
MARIVIIFLLLMSTVSASEFCEALSRAVIGAHQSIQEVGVKETLDSLNEIGFDPLQSLFLVGLAVQEENPRLLRVTTYLTCLEVME